MTHDLMDAITSMSIDQVRPSIKFHRLPFPFYYAYLLFSFFIFCTALVARYRSHEVAIAVP